MIFPLILLGPGCRASGPYDRALAGCEPPPRYIGSNNDLPISEGCYRALASTIEHWNFEARPHAFRAAASIDEWVVAGLYVVAMADLGTVGELRAGADPQREGHLRDAIDRVTQDQDLDDAMPASSFWLSWLDEAFVRVDVEATHIGHVARYDDRTLWLSPNLPEAMATPAEMGATVAHEAAHSADVPHQTDANGFKYDATPDGAFGVEAHWSFDWFRQAEPDSPGCYAIRVDMISLCGTAIHDTSAFAPCEHSYSCEVP